MEQNKSSATEILKTNNAALSSAKPHILPSQNANAPKKQGNLNNDLKYKGSASSTERVTSKDTSEVEQMQNKLSVSENIKSKEKPLASPILNESNDQGKPNMAQSLKTDLSKDQGKSNKDLTSKAAASSSTKTVIAKFTSEVKNEQSKLSVSESLKSKETSLPSTVTDLSKDINKLDKDLTSKAAASSSKEKSKLEEEQSKLSASENIKSKQTPLPSPILSQSNDQGKQNMAQNLKADQSKDQGKSNKDLITQAVASSSGTDLSKHTNKLDKDLTSTKSVIAQDTLKVKEEQSKLSAAEDIKSKETPLPAPILSPSNDQGKQNMAQNLKADQPKDQGKPNKDLTSKAAASSSTKTVIAKFTSEVKNEQSKLSVSESLKSKETSLPLTGTDLSNDINKPDKDLTSKAAASSLKETSNVKEEQSKLSASENIKSKETPLPSPILNQAKDQGKQNMAQNLKADQSKDQGKSNKDLTSKTAASSSTKSVIVKDTSEVKQDKSKLSVSENTKSKETPLHSPILSQSNDLGKQNMAQNLKADQSKDQGKPNKDLTSKAAASSSTKTVIAKFTSEVKNEQSKLSVSESLKSKEASLPSTVTDLSKNINKLDMDLTSKAAASSPKETSNVKEEPSKLSASESIKSKETPLPSPILNQPKDQGKPNVAQNVKADLSKDQGKPNKDLTSKTAASSSIKSVIAKGTLEVKQEKSKLSVSENTKSKEILNQSNNQGKPNMAQNVKADQSKDRDSPADNTAYVAWDESLKCDDKLQDMEQTTAG
ncbi:hypothetical protein AWZ03_009608 [Drosophila navojoa]|uniref:Uncharacterized protein n=1 Tax=Drosophila navojoa TaxID=7232 RepID=A0A484B5E2_DRONA|nr:hypothetical protein AWZ03_009608 [Drosophila navojoa]